MNKQALKKSRICKGDVVVVIAGRDRGKVRESAFG